MRILSITLYFIGVVQLVLGATFVLAPSQFASMMDLVEAPDWVNWLFVMMGARFLGFAYGMFLAAHSPAQHPTWIAAMIGIQAMDWLGTVFYLATGAVTLAQVTTASFLPLVFIAVLAASRAQYAPRPA